jgi:dTDP-4-amino-4,6-dideoxygalactose transaminase
MVRIDKKPVEFIDLGAQRRRMGDRIDRAVARVLDHGRFVLGPEVGELEQRLQAFSGAKHCVTCANGTDAIELALNAMGIGAGDAVVVPAFSYVASAEAVVRVGATPVFADVDARTFNLSAESAETAIDAARTSGLTPRCVMAVDLFGQPADAQALRRLTDAHGLKLLADAAQSFGATSRAKRVGVLADVSTTSFYPSKPLGCYGDGGAIFTDDSDLAASLRSLRCHGQADAGPAFVRVGRNSRLDTIQAAILIEKLSVFEAEIDARNDIAERYSERLSDLVDVPEIVAGQRSVWAQYTIRIRAGRDEFAAVCKSAGVPTAIHYKTPLHLHSPYRRFPRAASRLETAEALSREVLSLPMHADLDDRAQDRVIDAIREAATAHAPKALHADA